MEEEHPTKRECASRVDGQMGRRVVSVGYFIRSGVTCEVDAAAGSTSSKTWIKICYP